MKILVVAPHPDDESIGCGGALSLQAQQGHDIYVAFLTSGERGLTEFAPRAAVKIREDEARQACEVIGISKYEFFRFSDGGLLEQTDLVAARLDQTITRFQPTMIYLPHADESHPDHKAANQITFGVMSNRGKIPVTLRFFEIWTPQIQYSVLQDISSVMPRKIRAIRQHRSQLEKLRYDRAISGLNRYRAAMAKTGSYAEVYQEVDLQRDSLPPFKFQK